MDETELAEVITLRTDFKVKSQRKTRKVIGSPLFAYCPNFQVLSIQGKTILGVDRVKPKILNWDTTTTSTHEKYGLGVGRGGHTETLRYLATDDLDGGVILRLCY